MSYLHEVLAVEKDLENVSAKVQEEAIVTFTKKTEHFLGSNKRLEMFDENRRKEEAGFKEVKEIVTTVDAKLDYVSQAFIRYINAMAQKELTNQVAKADIITPEGRTLMFGVPATLLLALEGRLTKLRLVYESIPTLQPGVRWVPDEDMGAGVYRADEAEVRHKTEKVLESKIIVAPTDKHPAQVEKWTEDRPVGQYVNTRWSAMITPARKSKLLGKIDTLIGMVKQARMRANTAEVISTDNLGKSLISFISEE